MNVTHKDLLRGRVVPYHINHYCLIYLVCLRNFQNSANVVAKNGRKHLFTVNRKYLYSSESLMQPSAHNSSVNS